MTVIVPEAHLPWRKLSIAEIKRCICLYYKITEAQLCSNSRKRKISWPRQVAMAFCREFIVVEGAPISFPRIGLSFGGLDHTTAMHAPRSVAQRCKDNPKYAEEMNQLRSALVMRVAENERLAELRAEQERARQAPAVTQVDSPDTCGVELCSQF